MQPGSRVGHYEILSAIGKGGMGEVWKAQDTKLDREVAIKTLPPDLSRERDRLVRFEREAKLLASLNHAHIGAIFGIEDQDDTRYLVLELVEGATLADRLRDGALPVDEAIEVARQIAEALEAAHDQGVIHRDLKPDNIKLRPDGVVKVLDFGLAKLTRPAGVHEPSSRESMTQVGAILGTPAYMSPEQARGATIDKRTDVWAFGAILYEMLTGQPAFLGRDAAETLAAVIKTEPDWAALPRTVPPWVMAFLKRCLAKKARERVHDIADVRLALTEAFELPLSNIGVGDAGSRRVWPWLVAALVFASVGAAGALYWVAGPAPPAGSTITIRQLTARHGSVGAARFAPDGQVIVYGAAWDADPYRLYETRLGGGQSRLLDLNPGDLLAMSANGKLAVSLNREPFDSWLPRGVYAEVDLTGGAPRARAENVVAVEFGHDEEPIAIVRRVEGQSELEYPIGTVIHRDSVIGPPRVSPEGDRICFQTSYNSLRSAERGGPAEVIASPVPRINACAWNPNGEEIWFTYSPGGGTHENLEAVNLDGERRVLAALTSFSEIEDVSPQGQILMVSGSLRYSVHGSLAPSGGERDLSVFNATRLIQLSADGTAVLLLDDSGVQAGGSQGGGVFTRPTDGSPPTEVGSGRPLVMTQDGTLVAMLGDGAQRQITDSDSITLVPTGVGNPRTIRLPVTVRFSDRSPIGINAPEFQSWEFSDDGRRLLVPFAWEEGAKPRVWVYDLEEERAWAITAEGVTGPVVMSPDGRYVASNEARGLMVYAVETGSQTQVPGSAEPGKLVRWSSRPDVVYVVEQSGAGASVYERNIMTGARGFLREIRVPDPAGATRFDLSLSRTGEAYAYSLDRWLTNLFVIENAH